MNQRVLLRGPGGYVAAGRRCEEGISEIDEDVRGPRLAALADPTRSQLCEQRCDHDDQQRPGGKTRNEREERVENYHNFLSGSVGAPTSPRSMRARNVRARRGSPGWLSPWIEQRSRNSSQ